MFPCFARSLCKSAGIVLTTGSLGCVISFGSWTCATGTICRVGHRVFACLGLLVYYYCLFAVGVVRLVRLVVPITMVTTSLALLWVSLMFCMNQVLLILLNTPFVDLVAVFINDGIFWMCVLLNSSTATIRMAMVIIWRMWGVCWLSGCVVLYLSVCLFLLCPILVLAFYWLVLLSFLL